jgi:hypothetical protein
VDSRAPYRVWFARVSGYFEHYSYATWNSEEFSDSGNSAPKRPKKMALGCCGSRPGSPLGHGEEQQTFLPLNGLPPKAMEQLILPPPSKFCKPGAEVRAANDDYVLHVDLTGDGSCWEAVSITGQFGRCTLRLCGRDGDAGSSGSSASFEEERKRSRLAFDTELRLRKALGIDAMRVVCRLLASDTTQHVLILELTECTLDAFLSKKASGDGSSGSGSGGGGRGGSGLRVKNRWSEADAPRVLAAQQESAAKELLPLLLPVATLHKHSLVCADLSPSSFVRRADGSWRLLEVASCKKLGKRASELADAAVAFTCPEIAAAVKSAQSLPTVKRPMDIWSLGLLFFAAMRQGTRILDGPNGELPALCRHDASHRLLRRDGDRPSLPSFLLLLAARSACLSSRARSCRSPCLSSPPRPRRPVRCSQTTWSISWRETSEL